MKPIMILSILVGVLSCANCAPRVECAGEYKKLGITSASFEESGAIPRRHGFKYDNVSAQISWSQVPDGTKSIAMICDDPDAPSGDWVHWVIFNIPATSRGLPEGVPKQELLPDGSVQGTNDFGGIGYDGPAPPEGTHRYVFRVYALDRGLDLKPGAKKAEVLEAMAGHVLAEGQMVGKFRR